jgi:hypothetical protein
MSDERLGATSDPISPSRHSVKKENISYFTAVPIGLLNTGDVAEGVAGWRLVLAHVIDSSDAYYGQRGWTTLGLQAIVMNGVVVEQIVSSVMELISPPVP